MRKVVSFFFFSFLLTLMIAFWPLRASPSIASPVLIITPAARRWLRRLA